MSDPSETFSPPMLRAIDSSTPSADSEPGQEPCETPDGPTKFQSGLAAAPVRRSHKQDRSEDSTTTDISGPIGSDSLKPVDLLASLVSRYRAKTDSRGSTLFTIAWKVRATPSGRLIPAQRGSPRRTSATASTSWPSPVKEDAKSSARHGYMITGNPGTTLLDAARLTSPQSSWTTPVASDRKGTRPPDSKYAVCLPNEAASTMAPPASWATPVATEIGNTVENYLAMKRNMKSGPRMAITHPSLQAQLTAPSLQAQLTAPSLQAQPTVPEIASESSTIQPGEEPLEDSGHETSSGSTAVPHRGTKTGASGRLHPSLSCWLMSIPATWLDHAPRSLKRSATPSSSSKRARSSKP